MKLSSHSAFLLLISLNTSPVFCQHVFQKNYGNGYATYGPYGIAGTSKEISFFYSIGDCFDMYNRAHCYGIGMLTFDSMDVPISNYNFRSLQNDTSYGSLIAESIGGGKTMIVGSSFNALFDYFSTVIIVDSNKTVIKNKSFDYGGEVNYFHLGKAKSEDGPYYFFGYLDSVFTSSREQSILFCKADSLLNPIISKAFYVEYAPEISDFTFSNDGNILACLRISDSMFTNSFLILLKMDTNGNILWNKKISTQFHAYPSQIFSRGSEFFITGFAYDSIYARVSPFLMKVDSLGNILWCNKYIAYLSRTIDAISTSDGGFLFSGQYNNNGIPNAYLIKLDSMGNVNWNYYYSYGNLNHYHCERKDKGFYSFASSSWSLDSSYLYLLKTDSLGSTGCYEGTFPLTISNHNNFTVDSIHVAASDYMPNSFSFQLVRDTFSLYEITLCDGYTSVDDIHNNTGKLKIFPNPATHDVNIAFVSTKSEKGRIEIWDCMGRLLKTVAVEIHAGENIFELDINSFSKNLYFVKLITKELSLESKFLKME